MELPLPHQQDMHMLQCLTAAPVTAVQVLRHQERQPSLSRSVCCEIVPTH